MTVGRYLLRKANTSSVPFRLNKDSDEPNDLGSTVRRWSPNSPDPTSGGSLGDSGGAGAAPQTNNLFEHTRELGIGDRVHYIEQKTNQPKYGTVENIRHEPEYDPDTGKTKPIGVYVRRDSNNKPEWMSLGTLRKPPEWSKPSLSEFINGLEYEPGEADYDGSKTETWRDEDSGHEAEIRHVPPDPNVPYRSYEGGLYDDKGQAVEYPDYEGKPYDYARRELLAKLYYQIHNKEQESKLPPPLPRERTDTGLPHQAVGDINSLQHGQNVLYESRALGKEGWTPGATVVGTDPARGKVTIRKPDGKTIEVNLSTVHTHVGDVPPEVSQRAPSDRFDLSHELRIGDPVGFESSVKNRGEDRGSVIGFQHGNNRVVVRRSGGRPKSAMSAGTLRRIAGHKYKPSYQEFLNEVKAKSSPQSGSYLHHEPSGSMARLSNDNNVELRDSNGEVFRYPFDPTKTNPQELMRQKLYTHVHGYPDYGTDPEETSEDYTPHTHINELTPGQRDGTEPVYFKSKITGKYVPATVEEIDPAKLWPTSRGMEPQQMVRIRRPNKSVTWVHVNTLGRPRPGLAPTPPPQVPTHPWWVRQEKPEFEFPDTLEGVDASHLNHIMDDIRKTGSGKEDAPGWTINPGDWKNGQHAIYTGPNGYRVIGLKEHPNNPKSKSYLVHVINPQGQVVHSIRGEHPYEHAYGLAPHALTHLIHATGILPEATQEE
jgi:hypothetical protein